jgi:hypothetical protein
MPRLSRERLKQIAGANSTPTTSLALALDHYGFVAV